MEASLRNRSTCPECGYKNSVLTTIVGGIRRWYCFNAGCTNKGTENTGLDVEHVQYKKVDRKANTSSFISGRSNKEAFDYFNLYYLFAYCANSKISLWYDLEQRRAVFQYKDLYVGRALHKDTQPKWYIYSDTDYPFVVSKSSDTVVIVEDVVSAIKVGQVVDSIALQGTNLKEKYIKYIKDYKNVIVALDEDATTSALKIQDTLQLFTKCKVLPLTKDLKYYTVEEIKKLIGNI